MWFVALQPCQGQPCDCFEHLLVITLSTWAKPLRKKNGAHIVKRGIRIMLLLLGIPPKLILSKVDLSDVSLHCIPFNFIQAWLGRRLGRLPCILSSMTFWSIGVVAGGCCCCCCCWWWWWWWLLLFHDRFQPSKLAPGPLFFFSSSMKVPG